MNIYTLPQIMSCFATNCVHIFLCSVRCRKTEHYM